MPSSSSDDSSSNSSRSGGGPLLIYSSGAGGWTLKTAEKVPRLQSLEGVGSYIGSRSVRVAVLRAESIGSGADFVYMIPEQLPGSNSSSLNAVVMSAARGYSPFPMPHIHRQLRGSALAAARGRLYMFGGWSAAAALTRSELEVYDPHIDSWFSTGAMLPGKGQLQGHCMVTNQHEGLLLALGGCLEPQQSPGASWFAQQSSIFVYDIRGGSWAVNPSGCTWPGAAAAVRGMSAVPLDPFTVMVMSSESCNADKISAGDADAAADEYESEAETDSEYDEDEDEAGAAEAAAAAPAPGTAANVDLLDLRMWRWRQGAPLIRRSGCIQSIGLAMHEGRAVAAGGARPGFWGTGQATREVNAYDVSRDAWSVLPPLPFAVCGASPVSVKMPSGLNRYSPRWLGIAAGDNDE
ncbi:hypothetical protein OEZ85_006838 [Tetradesmus obliquus]|uniref:Uncharacterized protein n=1 Tax=Tetradesmus obliquus TaxID=3088 RepID=A0ABY8U0P5_TETOB|nr:hypothetical protein OEZ85_006838 [Tetradesmus obliquus]